jgi:hypothetical protein
MRRAWRLPLVASALLSLAWGVWLGLLRLGWILPLPWPDQLVLHGPLMIGGYAVGWRDDGPRSNLTSRTTVNLSAVM